MHRRVLMRRLAVAGRDKRSFLSPLDHRPRHLDRLSDGRRLPGHGEPGLRRRERRARAGTPSSRNPSPARCTPPRCRSSMPTSPPARSPGRACQRPASAAVAFRGKGKVADATPDEDRIVRADKKGRIVHVVAGRAAEDLQRRLDLQAHHHAAAARAWTGLKMAFAKPDIRGKEIEIATGLLHPRGQEARSRRPRRCSPASSTTTRPTCWPPPMRRPNPTTPRPRPSRAC